jgi:hypothetical protein
MLLFHVQQIKFRTEINNASKVKAALTRRFPLVYTSFLIEKNAKYSKKRGAEKF